MPRLGIKSKSRRKAGIGGFHAEYLNDRVALRERKKLGLTRTIFSGLSLLFGGFMIYVSLHYIPAFVQPRQILKFATGETSESNTYNFDRHSKFYRLFGPYVELFHMDRAYMKAGQQVYIKYDLPDGAHVDLEIVQCSQAWVIEIFNCKIVGKFNSQTKRRNGIESYTLDQTGFYHFRATSSNIPKGEAYRIVWKRWI